MLSSRTTLPNLDDTIVALATPTGPGLRAIIRLTGRQSAAIAARLFLDFNAQQRDRRLVAGHLAVPGVPTPLPADLYFFPAPHTYTGQDTVELHTLSCPPLVELVVAESLN